MARLFLVYSLVANMIQVTISLEDQEKINSERFRHHDPIVARHLHVLYCKSLKMPHQEICSFVDISRRALGEVLKQYIQGGLAAVMQTKWKSKRFVLDDHRETIEQHFRTHPPESVKVAASEIEKLTGIKRGQTQIRTFLHKIGMEPRKVAGIPAKADPAKQEEFKKKVWNLP